MMEIKEYEWMEVEDFVLFDVYEKFGNKWMVIVKLVGGRIDNGVKNRFKAFVDK